MRGDREAAAGAAAASEAMTASACNVDDSTQQDIN